MKTETLCQALMQEACVDRVHAYRRTLEQMPLDRIKDPFWLRMATLARSLPAEDRETLLAFPRQVAIDACSIACGALDGNTSLAGQFFEFSLLDEQGQQHVGLLQESFLELVQGTGN